MGRGAEETPDSVVGGVAKADAPKAAVQITQSESPWLLSMVV